ncbi:MAG: hypothetical protein RSC60_02640 [Christensenellaceae bacterium]
MNIAKLRQAHDEAFQATKQRNSTSSATMSSISESRQEYKEMPLYPDEKSVQMIDGVAVVKIS